MKVPVAYVSGAFTGKGYIQITNIARAKATGRSICSLGVKPIVPHAIGEFCDGLQPHPWWMQCARQDMEQAGAVVLCPHSEKSCGTIMELKWAEEMGLPIFRTEEEDGRIVLPVEFIKWIQEELNGGKDGNKEQAGA